MNRRKWSLLLPVFMLLLLLIPSGSYAASDDDVPSGSNRIQVDANKYPMKNYQLESNIGDGFTESVSSGMFDLVQGLWGINTTIASFTMYAVDKLMTFDLLSDIIDKLSIMSKNIYDTLAASFLGLLIVITGGVAAHRYFVNQQMGVAIKTILTTLIILVVSTWFYSDTASHVSSLNKYGQDIEGIAASANIFFASDGQSEPVSGEQPASSSEGMSILKNQMFDLMVMRPYLLMQYGTTNAASITAEDSSRIDGMLALDPYSDDGIKGREEMVSKEVDDYDNHFMTKEANGARFGYAFFTIISTVALSVPMIMLATFKFMLQIGFLALIIFAGIPLILALLPAFSGSAMNHMKKIVGVLLMKGALVLITAVIVALASIIYETVQVSDGIEGYVFVVFIMIVVIFSIIKYRDQILEVASAGMIQGNVMAGRMTTGAGHSLQRMADNGGYKAKRMASQGMRALRQRWAEKDSKAGLARKAASAGMSMGSGSGGATARQAAGGALAGATSGAAGATAGKAAGAGAGALGASTGSTAASTGNLPKSSSRSVGGSGQVVNLSDYVSKKGTAASAGTTTGSAARSSSGASATPTGASGRRTPGISDGGNGSISGSPKREHINTAARTQGRTASSGRAPGTERTTTPNAASSPAMPQTASVPMRNQGVRSTSSSERSGTRQVASRINASGSAPVGANASRRIDPASRSTRQSVAPTPSATRTTAQTPPTTATSQNSARRQITPPQGKHLTQWEANKQIEAKRSATPAPQPEATPQPTKRKWWGRNK